MAMVVKNNMSAVRTLNTLNQNSNALQKSLAKVSSGMKINSAQDDASGYAISERMRVQIRSLDQANQNTQNGSSMMKTAEGAVSSTVEILKSLKEKAINAANDTNKDSDRVTIQKEIDQFIDQIDDNALTTFNGKYLVDGSKNNAHVATNSAFTNQSLDVNTTGKTLLAEDVAGSEGQGLKNRVGESLEINSTDYVTASYVKDGNTHTTTFRVGNNTVEDIFNNLNKLSTGTVEEVKGTDANGDEVTTGYKNEVLGKTYSVVEAGGTPDSDAGTYADLTAAKAAADADVAAADKIFGEQKAPAVEEAAADDAPAGYTVADLAEADEILATADHKELQKFARGTGTDEKIKAALDYVATHKEDDTAAAADGSDSAAATRLQTQIDALATTLETVTVGQKNVTVTFDNADGTTSTVTSNANGNTFADQDASDTDIAKATDAAKSWALDYATNTSSSQATAGDAAQAIAAGINIGGTSASLQGIKDEFTVDKMHALADAAMIAAAAGVTGGGAAGASSYTAVTDGGTIDSDTYANYALSDEQVAAYATAASVTGFTGTSDTALADLQAIATAITTADTGNNATADPAETDFDTLLAAVTTDLANTDINDDVGAAGIDSMKHLVDHITATKVAPADAGTTTTTPAATTDDAAKLVADDTLIGTNKSGDAVYTADGTKGLTVTAAQSGVAGQVAGVTISITDSDGNVKKAANAALDGFAMSIRAENQTTGVEANNVLTFQVGAAANQAISVSLTDMRSEALGLKGSDGSKVSVATQEKANAAIAVFDNAITKALDQQTTIGSIEARLEYTSQNLTTSSENVQAAESTIRDADMAKEMTNYTKNNVLLQAAQSMLAQANQSSSAVLSLLQ